MKDDTQSANTTQRSWKSNRLRLLTFAAIAFIIILSLALGLGLGLGLHRNSANSDDSSNSSNETDSKPLTTLLPTPDNATIWRPAVDSTWQIVLLEPLAVSENATAVEPNVDIFDIDLFTNDATTVDNLHRLGKKYRFYEPDRPDSAAFAQDDLGKELDGWPGEHWLRVNSSNVRAIIKERLQLAAQKKCDAVDPDNVDGYGNDNGLGLTKQQAVDYLGFLSSEAHNLGLAIGLKNAGDIIDAVLPGMQFSVNEQCVQFKECMAYSSFINASKPVFHIEYPSKVDSSIVRDLCGDTGSAAGAQNFSTVIKKLDLDGWIHMCDGEETVTPNLG